MKFLKMKKSIALLAAAAVVAIAAIGAYAYWTATGTGSGTADVAAASGDVTVSGAEVGADLVPGGNEAFDVTIVNPNTYTTYIEDVDGVVSVDDPHATAGCLDAWFHFNGDGVAGSDLPLDISTIFDAAGGVDDEDTFGAATISMDDEALVDQDACKGASLTVDLTANPTP